MVSAEQLIEDNGYEEVIILQDFSYDSALIGVTEDNRAVYDYDLMVKPKILMRLMLTNGLVIIQLERCHIWGAMRRL